MVQQPRRGRRRKKLLGSHQRCWIWGRFPVLETLRAGRWPALELRLADRLSEADGTEAKNLAGRSGVQITVVARI
jgi:23S rRNA (guanosine2251-2'-O)-methyltransferase